MKLIFYFVKRCVLLALFEVRNRQNFESVRNKISCAHMTREKNIVAIISSSENFSCVNFERFWASHQNKMIAQWLTEIENSEKMNLTAN